MALHVGAQALVELSLLGLAILSFNLGLKYAARTIRSLQKRAFSDAQQVVRNINNIS